MGRCGFGFTMKLCRDDVNITTDSQASVLILSYVLWHIDVLCLIERIMVMIVMVIVVFFCSLTSNFSCCSCELKHSLLGF